jgi:UDP-N-acetylglucosamine 2-epimerase (non-hydrolysing)
MASRSHTVLGKPMKNVLTLFGTRPEIIKLAPVVWALEERGSRIRNINVCSSQHTDLLRPFVAELGIRIDEDLAVMTPGQTLSEVLAKVTGAMGRLIDALCPDLVLVQGDTTTAIGGAIAAFYARVPVGHVEAGLRTMNRHSPFPEEMNRRLITRIADLHFAATSGNVATLVAEGVPEGSIFLTGNPVIDTLNKVLAASTPSRGLSAVLGLTEGKRLIVLTTHRRENFGSVMRDHLRALRSFSSRHAEVALIFPVHPNPAVREAVAAEFGGLANVHCIAPLDYTDFLHLLSKCWLIVSDSGGIQEEAPSLGKPLLVLRDTTERPEVLESGIGRLVGHSGERLEMLLEEALQDTGWAARIARVGNPFGDGLAGPRIVDRVERFLGTDRGSARGAGVAT